jgi:ABC-2 type transport system permease protein/lipopolysaccharide transport system permease protein
MTTTSATTLNTQVRWSGARRYYELLSVLVERNLKGRYRGSLLGIFWSLLNPAIMTALYTAIFGTVFKSYFDNSSENYILAAFTGLVVINFFNAATNQALPSIVSNGSILNKIHLPVSIFPVSMVLANIFQFAVSVFPLLGIVTIWKSGGLLNVIALIFPFISLTLVCIGVSFLVSTLYVFFRDLPYFYEIICFVLWISSPIFYPVEIVPDSVRPFLFLNPLLPIIESIRQLSLSPHPPNVNLIAQSLLGGIIILSVGWSCFRAWRHLFMDLL